MMAFRLARDARCLTCTTGVRHFASFQHLAPSTIVVGGGAAENELPSLVKSLGMKRPLIVTDPVMVKLGLVDTVRATLAKSGFNSVGIFSDTVPEPTTKEVNDGVKVFTEGQHDGIVAVGGGSPIDIAKVVGIVASNGGHVRDYKVPNVIPKAGPPVIAVPTTAGTGSEVTKAAVISDPETQEKMLCMSQLLIPTAAVVDYKLTLTCPYRVIVDSGLDALTHAIEAYVSKRANSMTDANALKAMQMIQSNIRIGSSQPSNEPAREALMLGATLAGLAFSNASVALVHGMSRPIGVHFHVPHGLSNAMLLPAVTKFSIPGAKERYAVCARTMGLAAVQDSDDVACAALLRELEQLNLDLKVPTPGEFGIPEAKFMELRQLMAEQALASGSPGNNPRVPSVDEMVQLYAEVYSPSQASAP